MREEYFTDLSGRVNIVSAEKPVYTALADSINNNLGLIKKTLLLPVIDYSEKFSQLVKLAAEISPDVVKFLELIIDNCICQATMAGLYCGFDVAFWTAVKSEMQ